jgi:hypothetical protein
VICGYSLLSVDERARKLLLDVPKKDTDIVVASGEDTERIVRDYRDAGYARAVAAKEAYFQEWVASYASSVAGIR